MRIVLCTCPTDRAEALARALVERGAACVNVVPQIRSIYRWNGAIHDEAEALLVVKVAADRVEALRAALPALHPYELPEWVVLAPDAALTSPAYAAWVRDPRVTGYDRDPMKRRILIIEDHPDIRELMAEILAAEGHEVSVAAGGHEAIDRLSSGEAPDVIVADVMMPHGSGAELARWVRASERHRTVRLVIMSASPPATDLAARADAFLPKPFDVAELARVVA